MTWPPDVPNPIHELPLHQVGILVKDIGVGIRRYAAFWGTQWQLWTYDERVVPHLTYRGEPGHFQMKIALSTSQPQIELIQPTRGPSLYHEWTDLGRFGLHHLAVRVPDLSAACEVLQAAGYVLLQSGYGYGVDGDGGFAYFDTVDELGVYFELVEIPRRRIEPERSYPASPSQAARAR